MNTLKTLLFTLLLSSSVSYANDYALLDTYPLINDMKVAKKQLHTLESIRETIINNQHLNNREKLASLKNKFTNTLTGLREGNSNMNLQGTQVIILKNKISFIKLLWEQEQSILDSAINSSMYKNDALATLNLLKRHIRQLNRLYDNSYARYKQNSIMKTLVRNYMRQKSRPRYAMNIIR